MRYSFLIIGIALTSCIFVNDESSDPCDDPECNNECEDEVEEMCEVIQECWEGSYDDLDQCIDVNVEDYDSETSGMLCKRTRCRWECDDDFDDCESWEECLEDC